MGQLLSSLGLLALVTGCAGFYLASPNQRWLSQALPGVPTRLLGSTLLGLGWLGLYQTMQAVTATFVAVTTVMLALILLPYGAALRGLWRRGQ